MPDAPTEPETGSEPPHASQLVLVTAILREMAEQGFPDVTTRQMNAVIEAADLVVAAYKKPYQAAAPASGLDAWLLSDETGLSSLCMARTLAPLAGIARPVRGPK